MLSLITQWLESNKHILRLWCKRNVCLICTQYTLAVDNGNTNTSLFTLYLSFSPGGLLQSLVNVFNSQLCSPTEENLWGESGLTPLQEKLWQRCYFLFVCKPFFSLSLCKGCGGPGEEVRGGARGLQLPGWAASWDSRRHGPGHGSGVAGADDHHWSTGKISWCFEHVMVGGHGEHYLEIILFKLTLSWMLSFTLWLHVFMTNSTVHCVLIYLYRMQFKIMCLNNMFWSHNSICLVYYNKYFIQNYILFRITRTLHTLTTDL